MYKSKTRTIQTYTVHTIQQIINYVLRVFKSTKYSQEYTVPVLSVIEMLALRIYLVLLISVIHIGGS